MHRSVDKCYFAHIAWLRFRSFISISETDAQTEFISVRKIQLLNKRSAKFVVREEAYRAAQADRTYSE